MNWIRSLFVVGVVLITTAHSEKNWSWTNSEKKGEKAEAQSSVPLAHDEASSNTKRDVDQPNTQGRSLGLIDKISCKIGLVCKQDRHYGGPIQVYPPRPIAAYPPLPVPIGPPPILLPSPIPIPGPLPAPFPPRPPVPQPILPYPPVNKIPVAKPYPSIKSTKTEIHHHLHTHIHEDKRPIHGGNRPYSDTHKTNFSPTILSRPKPIGRPTRPISARPRPISGGIASSPYVPDAPLYRESCICVPKSQCSPYDLVSKSGTDDLIGLINPRYQPSDILAKKSSGNKNEKRSRNKRNTVKSKATARSIGGYPRNSPQGCPYPDVCCRNPLAKTGGHQPVCGISGGSSAIHGRIATTNYREGDTSFGQYPWQVAILRDEQYGQQYDVFVCGGTLISDRHVLTAAHCIDDYKVQDLKVRMGEWDVNGENEFYPHVDRTVAELIIHPHYYAGNLNNDLAIITIQGYLDANQYRHILPVCLPDQYSNFDHQRCTVTGWGKDAFGHHGKYQHVLKELKVPIVDRRSCEYALQSTRLGPRYQLPQGFMCAGGEPGKDSCEGDGGGPLVCPTGHNTFQLAGIVSWGVGCGKPGVPGVYVDIPYYLEWIRSVTHY